MKLNILDCSLRDGGYYNNWNFSISFVNKYLHLLSKSNIKYIEIGFKSLINDKEIGLAGKCDDKFLVKLNVPKGVNLGVMINSSDFINKPINVSDFFKTTSDKIKFVRLATHEGDILKIGKAITWLKNNGYIVAVNIMQISEIKFNQIRVYCDYLKKLNVDILYFADSLGCLKPNDIKIISKIFKKNWHGDIGIHAHDNFGLALKNTKIAYQNGVNWVDSTILGMGRGPGNTKTESLISSISKSKFNTCKYKNIKNELIILFKILKKKYRWGTNKYYHYSGKKKIHPTYIQEILANRNNSKKEIFLMIKGLAKLNVKKYSPFNMYFIHNFLKKNNYAEAIPKKILNNEKILIVGPGKTVYDIKERIKSFIINKKLTVLYTNKVRNLFNIKNYFRIACHPLRLLTDSAFHIKSKDPLIVPVASIPKKIFNKFKKENKKLLNFGLKLNKKNIFKVGKSNCSLPEPLIIGYSLCFAISANVKKIYIAGFDGFKKDDPYNDTTQKMINIIKKKFNINYINSLTNTYYKLK